MRIGIDCENLEDSSRWGVSQIIINLVEVFGKDHDLQVKHELFLYFKNNIPSDTIFQNPSFKIRVVKLPLIKRTPFNIYYHILMPIRAMRDGLDIMFFPSYMLPPLYLFKSIVLLTSDVHYEYKRGTLPFRYRLAYRLFSNWAALRASKILAISESSKQELVGLYKIRPEKIFVSLLGVDINRMGSWQIKTDLNFPYLLYVGQMFPRRRAKESIQAFEKIAPDFPGLKFILIGRDKYPKPIIQDLVRETNEKLGTERVLYYDYLDKDEDLRSLYRHATLFVYISSSESFGLPPVEAACHGVPVVVKDVPLNRELFGDAAFFVANEYDPDFIADVFKKGLTDEQHRLYCKEQYKQLPQRLNWTDFAYRFFNIVTQ